MTKKFGKLYSILPISRYALNFRSKYKNVLWWIKSGPWISKAPNDFIWEYCVSFNTDMYNVMTLWLLLMTILSVIENVEWRKSFSINNDTSIIIIPMSLTIILKRLYLSESPTIKGIKIVRYHQLHIKCISTKWKRKLNDVRFLIKQTNG